MRGRCGRCGVFFKKRVAEEIRKIQSLDLFGEEIGTSFGGMHVADIVALDKRQGTTGVFVIECKRLDPSKAWVFFSDHDRRYRICRVQLARPFETNHAHQVANSAVFASAQSTGLDVCSDGYEFPIEKRLRDGQKVQAADQDPVHKACGQVASATLGLIINRLHNRRRNRVTVESERFFPLLVTTAQLLVAEGEYGKVDLTTGTVAEDVRIRPVDYLVYNQPLPTPEGVVEEFRIDAENDRTQFQMKESVYVVRASALTAFFAADFRFQFFSNQDSG